MTPCTQRLVAVKLAATSNEHHAHMQCIALFLSICGWVGVGIDVSRPHDVTVMCGLLMGKACDGCATDAGVECMCDVMGLWQTDRLDI